MNRQFPLPAVTSPIAPDLRRFLDRVKEGFDDPDGLVTKKEHLTVRHQLRLT